MPLRFAVEPPHLEVVGSSHASVARTSLAFCWPPLRLLVTLDVLRQHGPKPVVHSFPQVGRQVEQSVCFSFYYFHCYFHSASVGGHLCCQLDFFIV